MSPYRYSPWFERFTRRQLVADELGFAIGAVQRPETDGDICSCRSIWLRDYFWESNNSFTCTRAQNERTHARMFAPPRP
jgi:hypothetical protein